MILVLVWLRKKQVADLSSDTEREFVIPDVETEPLPERKNDVPGKTTSTQLPADKKKDDLTVISGVGPKMAEVLNSAGITNFSQLAEADPDEIIRLLDDYGYRLGDPVSWIDQAKGLSKTN
jgi:predicted flap endonuclease-1-like 5' DNA nuclease